MAWTMNTLLTLCKENLSATNGPPHKRPVMRSSDVVFSQSKQAVTWMWLFETEWRRCDVTETRWCKKLESHFCCYSAVPFYRGPFNPKSSPKTPHNSSARARYGVSFVGLKYGVYSASVTEVMYAISCCIGPRYNRTRLYFSHPSLGWLYVFSSFPPRPPPQQLLPLTSKLFQLNLRYLAQRINGSGEMYAMAFPWPWPKATAVASISKICLSAW